VIPKQLQRSRFGSGFLRNRERRTGGILKHPRALAVDPARRHPKHLRGLEDGQAGSALEIVSGDALTLPSELRPLATRVRQAGVDALAVPVALELREVARYAKQQPACR
jgi:hypothetical protein